MSEPKSSPSSETEKIARRCLVSGRVQGVFFRASAREQALRLGVDGAATNLPDGCVEVLCAGTPQAVEALCAWLRQGPPAARVDRVVCDELDVPPPPGFLVG